MESILDAPSVRRATYKLSVANYHQLNEIGLLRHDVELLDGYLIKKMSKSPLHTEEIDLGKAALYAEAAVTEYWLVEPRNNRITVFRSPRDRAYDQSTVFEGAQTVAGTSLPGFEVDSATLFG